MVLLDTPFGFQENADQITARIGSYFRNSLDVDVEVASLRGIDVSDVELEQARLAVHSARYVFAGPGDTAAGVDWWLHS